ncbi:MAG TPA: hypothetical protein VLT59_02240 [Steroidobacteraceae bacterium]|nr:hypothetical protein [Steroidobacteraceae bacterium]
MSSTNVRGLVVAVAVSCLPVAALADDWAFRLTPYLWFAGLEGDMTPVEGLPSVPVDVSPSQALEDTETGVMVMFDARRGGHGLYLDFIYTDVRSDDDAIPELGITVRSTTKSTVFSAAYEYAFVEHDRGGIDALVGARYWEVDAKLAFSGPLGLTGSNKEDWIDPFFGVKSWSMLGDSNFYAAGGVGFGGFGVGSDFYYEINANVGYRWSKAIGTAIGYRYFDVDYDDNGFTYDAKQQGWQISLTWSF